MKKVWRQLLALALVCTLLLFSACSGAQKEIYSAAMESSAAERSEVESPDSQSTAAEEESEPEIDPSDITTLKIFFPLELSAGSITSVIDAYEAIYPGVHFEVEYGYGISATAEESTAVFQQLRVDLAAGEAADIIETSNITFQDYGKAGLFCDLAPFIASSDLVSPEDYFAAALETFKTDGKLYAMPIQIWLHLCSLNQNILTAAGLTLGADGTASYNEIIDTTLLCAEGNDTLVLARDTGCGAFWDAAVSDFIDSGSKEARFDTPEFIEYLERTAALPVDLGAWDISSIASSAKELSELNREEEKYFATLISGFAEFSYELMRENEGVTAPILLTSEDGNGIFSSANTLSVASSSTHQEEAWKFIEFAATQQVEKGYMPQEDSEAYRLYTSIFNVGPVYRPLAHEKAHESYMRSVISYEEANEIPESEKEAAAVYWTTISEKAGHVSFSNVELTLVFISILDDFYNGRLSAEDCARQMQERAEIWMAE